MGLRMTIRAFPTVYLLDENGQERDDCKNALFQLIPVKNKAILAC